MNYIKKLSWFVDEIKEIFGTDDLDEVLVFINAIKAENEELYAKKDNSDLSGRVRALELSDSISRTALYETEQALKDGLLVRTSFVNDSDYVDYLVALLKHIIAGNVYNEDIVTILRQALSKAEDLSTSIEEKYIILNKAVAKFIPQEFLDSSDVENSLRRYTIYLDKIQKDAKMYRTLIDQGVIREVESGEGLVAVFANSIFHVNLRK